MDFSDASLRGEGLLGKISYWILGALVVLVPFFIFPSSAVGVSLSKSILISVGVLLSLALFLVSIIKDATIELPKNLFSLSLLLIPVVFLLSTIANGVRPIMLYGEGFEVGTLVFISLCAVAFFLVAEIFQRKERVFYAYLGFLAAFLVVVLFHVVRFLFGADILSFGFLTVQGNNLLGNWNDLGIFVGAVSILTLIGLEMLTLNKTLKILAYVVYVLSLVFLAIVNFSIGWIVLGFFALAIFLYVISFDKFSPSQEFAQDNRLDGTEGFGKNYSRKISWNALALLLLCVVFFFGGQTLGNKIARPLGISTIEIRPSASGTIAVGRPVISESPLLGSGPNTFTAAWLMNKPQGVNSTALWSNDFEEGVGLIPTFVLTTGVLGLAAWIFFFAMFVITGIKAIFQPINDLFSRFLITSSFLVALFAWVMTIVYVPSNTNLFLAFVFTGFFAASLYREKILKTFSVSFTRYPKLNFLSALATIVLLIGTVSLGYLVTERAIAQVYFQKSLNAMNEKGDLVQAENYAQKALALTPSSTHFRGAAELNTIRINEILNRQGATFQSVRDEFQLTLSGAINNARRATELEPEKYQNWLTLARIYASLVPQPLAIAGAYENAHEAYDKAIVLNPHNPGIYLEKARLEVAHNDLTKARSFVEKAIAEKQNYAEAHFLMSQIEVTEGNLARAIPSLETTILLSPNNPGLLFQLGLLKYNASDWNGAIQALALAIQQAPDYANAKYFLGLSLNKIGRKDDAILVFEDILKTNPDSVEVKNIIANLRAGKDPFAQVKPPLDNKPERRGTLPVEER